MTPSIHVSRKPVKYLTNKELLAEISRCKNTFSEYLEHSYASFDIIVTDMDQVTDEALDIVRAKKSKELTPKGGVVVPVPRDGLIVRLMTYDHIPLDPDRKRKSRAANQTHALTNFPPFKHFLIQEEEDGVREFIEVGRSHWTGGWDNGHFTPEKGRVTERMGMMYWMLVERYARRANWRGYCVDTETEAMTQRGWLRHDEINEQDTILSYEDGALKWSAVKSIYRGDYSGDMFKLTSQGIDALVTPHHKFLTDKGLKEAEFLLEKDRLVLMGSAVEAPRESQYQDAFVEMVGWAITEGSFYDSPERKYTRIGVYQNEGVYADRIRNALSSLGAKHSESSKINGDNTNICFNLNKELCVQLCEVISNKTPSMPFMLSLTQEQRMLLINTMIDGDGWRTRVGNTTKVGYCQKCPRHTDAFVALCTMAGIKTSVKVRDHIAYGKPSTINIVTLFSKRRNFSMMENIKMHGAKNSGAVKGGGKALHPNEPTVAYDGLVWCPETEYGSFMARRNGCVYLTGNSYLDEMKSLALMQLSQVGLQFDESKSSNPFAFYTTTITNCLSGNTEILTREHGSVPISEVAGEKVTLLDGNGDWINCLVMDFGVQETRLTVFSRGEKSIDIWSTGAHRWISNGESITTDEIHSNEVTNIDSLYPEGSLPDDDLSWVVRTEDQRNETRTERVYCPVVPTTHSLALPCGIHTGQCFTRIFNVEKKNQNIRDDLLVAMGAAPSFTRQTENELSQNGSIEPTVLPTRRGRKTAVQMKAEKEASKNPIE